MSFFQSAATDIENKNDVNPNDAKQSIKRSGIDAIRICSKMATE